MTSEASRAADNGWVSRGMHPDDPLGLPLALERSAPRQFFAKLILNRGSFNPGQRVCAKVRNLGSDSITFGSSFAIERYTEGQWSLDSRSPKGPWPAKKLIVHSGQSSECMTFVIPIDFMPGEYRFTKFVSQKSKSKVRHTVMLTAVFHVVSADVQLRAAQWG
jgi:hypothetical protein